MQWRTEVKRALQLRNARACHVISLLDEVNRLKSEFIAATIAKKALERQAVVTVLASGHGDISGLLADTPLPPHFCAQLAKELGKMLSSVSKCDQHCETIMMRDPVFRAATERVVVKFLLPESAKNLEFGQDNQHDREMFYDLRVATLENEFAGMVCESLLVTRGIGGDEFDLPRMLRMLTAFRSMIADACYGGMAGQPEVTTSQQANKDDLPAMMDPLEALAARKARLAVTHEVGPVFPFILQFNVHMGCFCRNWAPNSEREFNSISNHKAKGRSADFNRWNMWWNMVKERRGQ